MNGSLWWAEENTVIAPRSEGTSSAVSCGPPPQTNIPASHGQRGAGHQQLHIGEGLELFFSNSHIARATHQSSPCWQWEPFEGAESGKGGDKGCSLPSRHCGRSSFFGGPSDFGPTGNVNLGSGLT